MTAQLDNNEAAMQQLHTIEAKTNDVALKLRERLPAQRAHLAAAVAAWKWVLHMRAQQQEQAQEYEALYLMIVKKMRMEIGAFDYQAREQAELLTRYLCDLDNILSHGDAEVKAARKAMVVTIQQLLQEADVTKVQSTKLKAWGERVIERLPVPVQSIVPISEDAQTETPGEMDTEDATADVDRTENADEEAMDEEEEDDDDDDQSMSGEQQDEVQSEADNNDEDEDDRDDDNQCMDDEEESPRAATTHPTSNVAEEELDVDVQSLPIWRPYFQIQKRRDGLYLVANLRGVNKRDLHIECEPSTGALRISGFKLPTQKDVMMSRWSRAPTFGRFEIVERFPAQMLNMAEATQLLRADGTLEIHLPYYMVQHPRFFRQPTASFFAPQRCAVW